MNVNLVSLIRIGVTAPSTSNLETTLPLVDLAQFDINAFCANGGLPYTFEFVVSDNEGRTDRALENTQAFKSMGINLIVGHGWSSQCQASLGYANQNDILLLSPSSTSPLLAIPEDNLFRLCPTDLLQALTIAEMLRSYGIKALLVIQRGDAWADGIFNILEIEYKKKGGIILDRIRYPPEEVDFNNYLKHAENILSEAIRRYSPNGLAVELLGFQEAVGIVKQASSFSTLLNIPWFGSDGTNFTQQFIDDIPDLISKIRLIGPLVAPASSLKYANLYDRYYSKTSQFLSYYSACMYDACWLYAHSIMIAKSTKAHDIKEILPEVASNFFGASGWCSLNRDGDRYTTNYDLWGYGAIENKVQNIHYGHFNGDIGKVFFSLEPKTDFSKQVLTNQLTFPDNLSAQAERDFTKEVDPVQAFASNLKYFNYNFSDIFGFYFIPPHIDDGGAFLELGIPCKTEKSFVYKLQILASIFGRTDILKIKGLIKTCKIDEDMKSISLLGVLLKEKGVMYNPEIINNLRNVASIRSKMYPTHETSPELKVVLSKVGINKYPLDDWEKGWQHLLQLCIDSLIGLVHALSDIK
jgi:branched-chain amino acid transport system substrate-binding protein